MKNKNLLRTFSFKSQIYKLKCIFPIIMVFMNLLSYELSSTFITQLNLEAQGLTF